MEKIYWTCLSLFFMLLKVITFPHTNKIMEIIRGVHLKTRSKGQDLECCQPRIWLEHLWSVMFRPTTENFASHDNFNLWRRKYLNLLQDSERDISVNNLLMSILRPAFHLQTIILVKIYIRSYLEFMKFCLIFYLQKRNLRGGANVFLQDFYQNPSFGGQLKQTSETFRSSYCNQKQSGLRYFLKLNFIWKKFVNNFISDIRSLHPKVVRISVTPSVLQVMNQTTSNQG